MQFDAVHGNKKFHIILLLTKVKVILRLKKLVFYLYK